MTMVTMQNSIKLKRVKRAIISKIKVAMPKVTIPKAITMSTNSMSIRRRPNSMMRTMTRATKKNMGLLKSRKEKVRVDSKKEDMAKKSI